jgi:hypothetical protein
MAEVYNMLQQVGFQHPETLTWINDEGHFLFEAKKKILAKLQVGGEAIVEYATDGITRATYLDLGDSSSLAGDDNFSLDVVGGYHQAVTAAGVAAVK